MISSIDGKNNIYSELFNKNRSSSNQSNNLISPVTDRTATDTVRISNRARELSACRQAETREVGSPVESDAEGLWDRIAAEYDVRKMTMDEMARMSQELYDGGAINLLDHAIMSFDGSRLAGESTFLTPTDSQGNRDWISEFEEKLALAQKLGNTQNAQSCERILGHLQKLDSAGGQPVASKV